MGVFCGMWCHNSQLDSLILGANLLRGFPVTVPLCTGAGGCDPPPFVAYKPTSYTLLRAPVRVPNAPKRFVPSKPCDLELSDLVAKLPSIRQALKCTGAGSVLCVDVLTRVQGARGWQDHGPPSHKFKVHLSLGLCPGIGTVRESQPSNHLTHFFPVKCLLPA